uniref:FecR family protein n=1 Tax=Pedobacter schmidteae TaxID=2201271 RepID=UPI000EADE49B|nr:FecR domain-containing protein [Pedobacter schmidteae]
MAQLTKKEFLELKDKYLSGNASMAEKAVLEAYYELFAAEPEVLDRIAEFGLEELEKKIKHRIKARVVELEGEQKPKVKRLWYRMASAAVVFLCLGAGLYLYTRHTSNYGAPLEAHNDIAPGGNKAILTLADGKEIVLSDVTEGQVAVQPGMTISKSKSGQLVYKLTAAKADAHAAGYNTLRTPKGGQYQIKLPDGTIVWLNAASSIRFPISFLGQTERRIELKGEAYFEVAKWSRKETPEKRVPFVVQSAQQKVEVLGTHFNIDSYVDEATVKTSLLEGSVRVSSNTGFTTLLKPDQQVILTANGFKMKTIEGDQAIAWKEGLFVFDGDKLEDIMKKIARWYDVSISYDEETLKNKQFSGSVSRNLSLSKVLEKLELAGGLEFSVHQQEIRVREK